MLYDQFFIDELKNRADLVRIIEPYAPLKKKGANWMGCCPFHQEKTPSFSVNPNKGFYKCFGCGKGGTAFNFLMEMEGLSFPEAVERVAEISGVPLPERVDDRQFQQSKKRREEKKQISEQIFELNRTALEFWEAELQSTDKKAQAAREYLEGRGISEEIQKQFRIGFSPDSWDALLSVLREKGADDKLIEISGLVSVNEEKERVFDRFRGRIMFPVLNVEGQPVAFGARAMGDEQPKYLNSPETPAYVKGQHLYGLFQSRESIRQKKFAILVEGYLDLIALYQFGVTNVAASLGTALTPEQSKLLARYTKNVVINYDGDSAGRSAAQKAILELLRNRLVIKVLVLPNDKDPDEFIREHGVEAYNLARSKAKPFGRFLFENSIRQRNLALPSQQMQAVQELLPYVEAVPIDNERRLFFDEVMSYCRVDDKHVQRDLWASVRQGLQLDSKALGRMFSPARSTKVTLAEQQLLELLAHDKELRGIILPVLEESDYENLATAPVFRAMYSIDENGLDMTLKNLLERLPDEELLSDFVSLLMMGEPKREPGEVIDEVLHKSENCVLSLRSMAIQNQIHEISQELILADRAGDVELLNRLVAEQLELSKMKQSLVSKIRET